jgi:hypothetical protein
MKERKEEREREEGEDMLSYNLQDESPHLCHLH